MEYIVLSDVGGAVEVYRRGTEGGNQLVGLAVIPGGYSVENAYVAPACEWVVWFSELFDEASGKNTFAPARASAVGAGTPSVPISSSGQMYTGIVRGLDLLVLWDSIFGAAATVRLNPPALVQPLTLATEFGTWVDNGRVVAALGADGTTRLVALNSSGTTGYVSTDVSANPVTVQASFAVPDVATADSDVAAGAAVMLAASAVSDSPFVLTNSCRAYDGDDGIELRSRTGFAYNVAAGTMELVASAGFFPPLTYTYRKYTVDPVALTAVLDDEQTIDKPSTAYYVGPPETPAFWSQFQRAVEVI